MVILPSSPMAAWYDLILTAQKDSTITLSIPLEHYLVSLLMRFTTHCTLPTAGMAMAYLEAAQDAQALQTIGDQCLVLSGLFPEQTERRALGLQHFIRLGQQAYASITAIASTPADPSLFQSLAEHFLALRGVLEATRTHRPAMCGGFTPSMAATSMH